MINQTIQKLIELHREGHSDGQEKTISDFIGLDEQVIHERTLYFRDNLISIYSIEHGEKQGHLDAVYAINFYSKSSSKAASEQ